MGIQSVNLGWDFISGVIFPALNWIGGGSLNGYGPIFLLHDIA